MLKLEVLELTNSQLALLDKSPVPTEEISTGLTSDQGATELYIYRCENADGPYTIVLPAGEQYNADPWVHPGHPSKEDILQDYLELNSEE